MAVKQVVSTACEVEIVTPEGIRLVFDTFQAVSDLLQVQTHYDMGEAAGTFALTFAPVRIEGRTYDQLIPLRSLVTIRMNAPVGAHSREDSTVMVGLTEDHGLQEDFSRGQPQRVVTVVGRSMALVFLDMQLRFFPGLADKKEGTLTVGDQLFNLYIPSSLIGPFQDPRDALRTVLAYFTGLPTRRPLPPRQHRVEVQQATQKQQAQHPAKPAATVHKEAIQKAGARPAAVQPERRKGGTPTGDLATFQANQGKIAQKRKEHPGMSRKEAALAVADEMGTETEARPVPPAAAAPLTRSMAPPEAPAPTAEGVVRQHNVLLNLQLPERTLADLLDMNDDQWSMFDDDIQVMVGANTPYALTLWHYLSQFVDGTFQEFFTRVEDGVVKVHFRAKPFRRTFAKTGTRFSDDDPTLRTLAFRREEWDSIFLAAHLRRQTHNVYNTFQVVPLLASTLFHEPGFEWKFLPVFLDKPDDPSYLLKYGIRLLRDDTPYLSTKVSGESDPTGHRQDLLVERAHLWANMASAWYGLGSEMYAGSLTVLGSPQWNIGHRLEIEDERGTREFYIEGVTHQYDFRTGRYLAHLRVTRGWYLAGLTDEREPLRTASLNLEMVTPQGDEGPPL
jgi:hypothetical protein